ncbi:MAG: mechanosensitive ion channel family protein [Scandinavium sp.]|uniref:mechanosensitive ion channel family protein n=1 Tax=Scandinavium sp. TaxID=2830653 RepID=UPI003F39172A
MLQEWLSHSMGVAEGMAVAGMIIGGGLTFLGFNFFISRIIIRRLVGCEDCQSDDINKKTRAYYKIALIFSLLVIILLALYLPNIPPLISKVSVLSSTSLLIAFVSWFCSDLLDLLNNRYNTRQENGNHSIKGYVQIGKIIVFLAALILIVATLADKSPLIILSSLGAAAAVILLLFQHTLISLVANIQVSSSDAIQLGDWVEIPHLDINGVVTDLALHTTTIKNWDNTLSRLPTKYFITEHYTNWQPMFSSGGRRIKRAFYIDQKTIRFINDEIVASLKKLPVMTEIAQPLLLPRAEESLNSNLALFRKYIKHYLMSRGDIRMDMLCMIRQMPAGPEGLPVEIYCFTSQVGWEAYEETQAEIFEFVVSVSHYFHLKIYQRPSDIHHFPTTLADRQ